MVLLFGNTLAASLIWGINTIFLLDAGLSNLEAFAANAFFTAGMVLFEIPTGVVADTAGRRLSYLLGTVTLSASTLLYVLLWQIEAAFWAWAVVSMLIGLGYTFFSGAVEAWLVDALTATGFTGSVDSVFGRGQVVSGAAMLGGSVAGGFIAEQSSLAVPFLLRGLILLVMFVAAFALMHDLGFEPVKGGRITTEVRNVAAASIEHGWRAPAVKWLMLESLAAGGVGIYAFYALQPYLLELYGDPGAYQIAGRWPRSSPGRRSSAARGALDPPAARPAAPRPSSCSGRTQRCNACADRPRRQLLGGARNHRRLGAALLRLDADPKGLPQRAHPSRQRATILSFDSLMSSSGGVWTQPLLGRAADLWGYAPSYLFGAGISALAIPFLALSRRENAPADRLDLSELQPAPHHTIQPAATK